MRAVEAGHVGNRLRQLSNRRLDTRPEVDRSGAVVAVGRQQQAVDKVLHVEKLAARRAVAPEHHLVVAGEHLPDQGRDHVGGLEVEVVARPVEVRGQDVCGPKAVLLAVGLRAHEHRLLRDAVRRVRLLRVAVPEVVLGERHRRELRVRAHRAGHHHLADVVSPRELEDVRAHHQVRVPVPARIGAVRADPADLCRQMEDELGPRLGEEPLRALPRRQVVLVAARDERLLPALLQTLDQMGADEPAASGDEDAHGRQGSRTGPVASPSVQRLPTPVAALGLVIAAVAVVGWWGAIAVGPAAGPDAAEHIRYAEYLDATGHLPPKSANYEYSSPPAYQFAAVYLQRAARTLSIGRRRAPPVRAGSGPPGRLVRAASRRPGSSSPPASASRRARVAAGGSQAALLLARRRRGVRPGARRSVVVRSADLARVRRAASSPSRGPSPAR